MTTKFLDLAGLKYAVTKLKALISAKQDRLSFDSTPTSGSSNPVTSDGIYQALNNGVTVSIEPSAGTTTWIEVPTENLYVGGTQPTSQNTIWIEVNE
ncbi:hypothetical protein [Megasphaera elsdenii]|uniref:Uncharacterized protein n=1 Tax=Megasphaera elsdenii CAG:570 TaxID=1263087 RepID=R7MV31_MEGEL|nr:hypothetical protein [Megasphaera elsdenii]CDF04435.1 unknown [Megasphaera elsdenii CAG:570]